jgi:hypothetical protein
MYAAGICRAADAAGEAAPRPYTDGPARRRCDRYLPRWGRVPRPVGVRRCLTRRPGGPAIPRCADHPGTGEIMHVVDTRHGNLPRRWRGGRGNASPLHRWAGTSPVRPIPATVGPYPPSCRGQAVPDPPARRAGNPTPMAAAVPLPITVQAVGIERPGLKPRAESPSPLKGAGRGAAGATNPPLGERHLDQPARGLRPAVFTPRSRRPRGGPGMAAGRTMMGRRCCPPIRLA